MNCRSTKYEQNQRKRFNRRMDERRERLERLARLSASAWHDTYVPLLHALTDLVHELVLIDKEIICAYLADHARGPKKEG